MPGLSPSTKSTAVHSDPFGLYLVAFNQGEAESEYRLREVHVLSVCNGLQVSEINASYGSWLVTEGFTKSFPAGVGNLGACLGACRREVRTEVQGMGLSTSMLRLLR